MSGAMEAPRPTQCPICLRSLEGLSSPVRCPTCGFAADADIRMWRSRQTWARVALRYTTLGVFVGVLIALLYRVALGHSPNPALPLLLAAAARACSVSLQQIQSESDPPLISVQPKLSGRLRQGLWKLLCNQTSPPRASTNLLRLSLTFTRFCEARQEIR